VSPYPSFFLGAVDFVLEECEQIAGRGLTLRQSQVLGWFDPRAGGGRMTRNANAKTKRDNVLQRKVRAEQPSQSITSTFGM
jgi:hypothetical protein